MPDRSQTPDAATRMRYAIIRGEEYVNVRQVVAHLREQGWGDVADWLEANQRGIVTKKETLRVR